jgi:hypothetical protein
MYPCYPTKDTYHVNASKTPTISILSDIYSRFGLFSNGMSAQIRLEPDIMGQLSYSVF